MSVCGTVTSSKTQNLFLTSCEEFRNVIKHNHVTRSWMLCFFVTYKCFCDLFFCDSYNFMLLHVMCYFEVNPFVCQLFSMVFHCSVFIRLMNVVSLKVLTSFYLRFFSDFGRSVGKGNGLKITLALKQASKENEEGRVWFCLL